MNWFLMFSAYFGPPPQQASDWVLWCQCRHDDQEAEFYSIWSRQECESEQKAYDKYQIVAKKLGLVRK